MGNFYVDRSGVDSSTGATNIVEYAHHEIHGGSHYTAMWSVADIGAATNDLMSLTFVTPDTTKWPHMIVLFNGVGGALCTVREGGAGGASPTGTVTCFNNNRNSSNTSGLKDIAGAKGVISYDASVDSNGLLIVNEYIGGASTNQNKAGGGAESGGRYEWILKQNTRYQVALTSMATVAASIVLHWYEHTNR